MANSPYSKTAFTSSGALGVLNIRPIPAYSDDPIYTIPSASRAGQQGVHSHLGEWPPSS